MPYACIFVPDFPVEAILRAEPELRSQAVAVLEGRPPQQKIFGVNPKARGAGIQTGMTRLQAEACPDLVLRCRSAAQEDSAHAALLECAKSFSPRVENTLPDTLVFDISGTDRLFGPPTQLARTVAQRASSVGLEANVAIASNPDAATLAARGFSGITVISPGKEEARLNNLPLEVLLTIAPGLDPAHSAELLETFGRWGIRNLRALNSLPPLALSERMGQTGLRLQELSRGAISRTIVPVELPVVFEETTELEYPLVLLEPLAFLLGRMLDAVCIRLSDRALATQELHLKLDLETGIHLGDEDDFIMEEQRFNPGLPTEKSGLQHHPADCENADFPWTQTFEEELATGVLAHRASNRATPYATINSTDDAGSDDEVHSISDFPSTPNVSSAAEKRRFSGAFVPAKRTGGQPRHSQPEPQLPLTCHSEDDGLASEESEIAKSRRGAKGEHPFPAQRSSTFTRTLRLPVPMLDAKIFLKLFQLDLKAHPPGAPIQKITLTAEPARSRPGQAALFLPPTPEPEKLELTLARISGIVGEQNVGSLEMLDTRNPNGFRMQHFNPFVTEHKKISKPNGNLKNKENGDTGRPDNRIETALVTALRIFRPHLPAMVTLRDGRPAHIACQKNKAVHGEVIWQAGPWRSSGDWWEKEAWARDEWDIALQTSTAVLLYRLVRDLLAGKWFLEGTYD